MRPYCKVFPFLFQLLTPIVIAIFIILSYYKNAVFLHFLVPVILQVIKKLYLNFTKNLKYILKFKKVWDGKITVILTVTVIL